MKYFLALFLLSIHFNCCSSGSYYDLIEKQKDTTRKKAAFHKIIHIINNQSQNSTDGVHIKTYVGQSLFKAEWKYFTYPEVTHAQLSADEAIARNVIFATLEEKAFTDGRFDVYGFLRCNTDKLRFSDNKNPSSLMDTL